MAVGLKICDNCSNCRLVDGWNMVCDAFPDGVPLDMTSFNPKACSNSVHYTPKESLLREHFTEYES